ELCLEFSGLFEAELLTELMLKYWRHPIADDRDFRENLLETAAEALRHAAVGNRLFESLSAENTNLAAAIWFAEWSAVNPPQGADPPHAIQRRQWLESVRDSIPSCFVDLP